MREEILKYIEKFKNLHGYIPTQMEIAKGLKVSRQRINYHFKGMIDDLKNYPEYKRYKR